MHWRRHCLDTRMRYSFAVPFLNPDCHLPPPPGAGFSFCPFSDGSSDSIFFVHLYFLNGWWKQCLSTLHVYSAHIILYGHRIPFHVSYDMVLCNHLHTGFMWWNVHIGWQSWISIHFYGMQCSQHPALFCHFGPQSSLLLFLSWLCNFSFCSIGSLWFCSDLYW